MTSTHGTQKTAGPVEGPVAPEDTPATGIAGSNPQAMAAVTARARAVLGKQAVITDRIQLRTYQSDGLAHYR